ncbi:Uncharacterised protein [Bordetella pertussis]|nr:Uncharacterised protein [Bordetella pertussis]
MPWAALLEPACARARPAWEVVSLTVVMDECSGMRAAGDVRAPIRTGRSSAS